MIKNLKIKNKKINEAKIVKAGLASLTFIPVILAGCNSVNTKDYYLVCENSKYYICKKVGTFNKSDDYEFKSILDNKIIGSICSNRDNFNYETHRFSTNFLCELQVVSINELFNKDNISIDDLLNIANNNINEIGDSYFKNTKYYFKSDFEYDQNANLKLFNYNDSFILGYDISPKRLDGTSRYIYSIKDIDVIKIDSEKTVDVYEINIDSKDDAYITYNETIELLTNYQLEKVLKK